MRVLSYINLFDARIYGEGRTVAMVTVVIYRQHNAPDRLISSRSNN